MLETDTELDDFKDQMIEVTEEDMKKLAGAGDGDGDDKNNDVKKADDGETESAIKKDKSDKKAKEAAVEKQSAVGKVIAALIALVVIGGLVAIFVFTGLKNDIIGTWEYTVEDSDNAYLKNAKMELKFDDDGNAETNAYLNNVIISADKGTYTTKSGNLSIDWEKTGSVQDVEYEVKGDELIFKSEGKKDQIFRRVK